MARFSVEDLLELLRLDVAQLISLFLLGWLLIFSADVFCTRNTKSGGLNPGACSITHLLQGSGGVQSPGRWEALRF